MIVNAAHVSGCRLSTKYSSLLVSINRKATYELRCCHGVTVRSMGDSTFNGDDVGPCNVIKEHLKCEKTPGALRGMCFDSYNWYGTVF
jgi:hypothetical protein